jgi:fructose/tagatose bisphosphate aldolase
MSLSARLCPALLCSASPSAQVIQLFEAAKKHGFAIPAVNVVSSSSCNSVLEAAAKLNSPIIIQVRPTPLLIADPAVRE